MSKPLIVLFIDPPGSGKTTFAKQLAQKIDAVVLASDSMRMMMWGSRESIDKAHEDPDDRRAANLLTFGAMNYATKQIISAGHNVIYDANAHHRSERDEKYEIAERCGGRVVTVRLRVPYETALERLRSRLDSHDTRSFDEARAKQVLDQFISRIEELRPDEARIEIPGDVDFERQFALFNEGIKALSDR